MVPHTNLFRPTFSEEVLQVSTFQQFENDKAWMFLETDSNKLDDVRMIKFTEEKKNPH